MGLGFLTVQVHTGNDALPVADAQVIVRDVTGKVLYELTTDEGGNTERISLYAPDKYHTLSPEDTGPFYATYQVEVIFPGKYITEIVHDVQIFDTIESILPVSMLPLPTSSEALVSEIDIAPTAVGLPISRNQVSPLVTPLALREVFIPDFITVHLGHPNNIARNVRIRFVDYIKNVMYTKHQTTIKRLPKGNYNTCPIGNQGQLNTFFRLSPPRPYRAGRPF